MHCDGKARRWVAGILAALTVCGAFAAGLMFSSVWPEAPGENVSRDDGLTIDFSHGSDGYIMVHGPETNKRLKLRVKSGDRQLTYDLNGAGSYEVIPLQFGSGKYVCSLFKNASGNRYAAAGSLTVKAELNREDAAFLCPNQYVSYQPETLAVELSHQLLDDLETDQEKFDAVRAYIRENYAYDFEKAKKVGPGTMPDIDDCMERKMGICQDLSALAACMLRVQGIPTQFVIGYIGKYYHAWNVVLIDGEEIHYDATAELGAIPEGMRYTTERYY